MRPGSTPKVDRIKRVNERILRELSMGLYRIGQGRDVDLARISFVDVRTSPDLHGAIVVVSVLGTEAEAEKVMAWLKENRAAFQAHIARTVGLKYTPVLSFRRTAAIEKGNRVLSLLDRLDIPPDDPAPEA